MLLLKHPYISVDTDSSPSYGGSQMRSANMTVQKCGCGIIAAFDTLLYLSRWHPECKINDFSELQSITSLPLSTYNQYISRMKRTYFPIIPHAGMNGLALMAGMNLFFRKRRIPYHALWCMNRTKIWDRVEEMLREDIPVIMSIGPNFPLVWQNHRADFYIKSKDGYYVRSASAKAHYVTVTGMDDEWLRISSWGRRYYLNRAEFEDYVSAYSAGFVSNILYIKTKE